MASSNETNLPRPPVVKSLTRRLATPESMAEGLAEFLTGLKRYTVVIKRPGFSWDSGQFQTTDLTLYEDEKLVENEIIDPRLLKARRVTLIATATDGGTAKIDLTARSVDTLANSPDLSKLLRSLNNSLLKNARPRWITYSGGAALFFLPILLFILDIFAEMLIDPKWRHLNTNVPNVKYPPTDKWTLLIGIAILILWIVTIIAAIIIMLVVSRSGPLRIWPASLTVKALFQTLYRIRLSGAIPRNALFVIVTILGAVIGSVLTALLTKLATRVIYSRGFMNVPRSAIVTTGPPDRSWSRASLAASSPRGQRSAGHCPGLNEGRQQRVPQPP